MLATTPFHPCHVAAGAKLVEFAGWEMPIHYGSLIEEHRAVREAAGMFDVSHMTIVDITGSDAKAYLKRLLANNIDKCREPGQALYSCMLNDAGGIVDDLIAYYISDGRYRLVVNAGTRAKDLAWITQHIENYEVSIQEVTHLAILAVQGPQARELTHLCLPDATLRTACESLKPFQAFIQGDIMVARTGYTGEAGYELMFPAAFAHTIWDHLIQAGVKPCGLGARDTLRLEAGYCLYGHDMDETTTPLETGLSWTVAFDDTREFIGKAALLAQKAEGIPRQFVGVVLEGKGVLREGYPLYGEAASEQVGVITSGTFSPTLQKSIGFARIQTGLTDSLFVEMRGKLHPLKIVKPRFIKSA